MTGPEDKAHEAKAIDAPERPPVKQRPKMTLDQQSVFLSRLLARCVMHSGPIKGQFAGEAILTLTEDDMLKYVTEGYYPSPTHQVTNPTGDAATRSRVSTPLFLHPADDVMISQNKTAFDFLRDRIKEISGIELTK